MSKKQFPSSRLSETRPPPRKPKTRRPVIDSVNESILNDFEDTRLKDACQKFIDNGKSGWQYADSVVWIRKEDDIEEARMRWFYPPTGYKYCVYPEEPREIKEYYIWGILMNPGRTQDVTTGGYKVDRWSLGVCIHTGNNVFMPSMEVETPPIPRNVGYITQILAVIYDKDVKRRMTGKNNSAQHLEEVMRKKGLHCGSLPRNSPFLSTCAVLRTTRYLDAEQAIRDVDTLSDDFKDSVRYIESLRGDSWDTMEIVFSKGLGDVARALVERGLDYDGATEDIPGEPDIKMRLERLPHTTDKERTCAWKAAAQGQESASIPPGQLYMPVLIMEEQGERFRLMRVR